MLPAIAVGTVANVPMAVVQLAVRQLAALQGAAQNGHARAVKMLLETGNVNTGQRDRQ